MSKKQQTHIGVVREWCQSLGVLTAVSITRNEAELKLAAYVPMLMRDFPDAAFTTESLNHVARQCVEGFPTYPVLAARISSWWREHRPIIRLPPPPPEPPRIEPTPEEIDHVAQVVRQLVGELRSSAIEKEIIGKLDEPSQRPRPAYLTPAQLDEVNPLPFGRKRTNAAQATAALPEAGNAAAVDSGAAESVATAEAGHDRAAAEA